MTKSLFEGTPIAKGFGVDKDKVDNGVWRHHDSGISVRIRRGNRVEHKRALRKAYKPFAHLTTVDPKDELLVKMKAGAQELIADWGVAQRDDFGNVSLDDFGEPTIEPLVGAGGQQIRCTEENILKAFQDQPDFFDWVSEEADTFENYRIAAVEDAAGNSSPSSAGSESGDAQAPLPSSSEGQAGA